MPHPPENSLFQEQIEELKKKLSALKEQQQHLKEEQNVWEQALFRAVSVEDLRILLGKGREGIDVVDQQIQQSQKDLSSILMVPSGGSEEDIDQQLDQFFSSAMKSVDLQDVFAQVLNQWPELIGGEERVFRKRFEEEMKQGTEQDLISSAIALKKEILWERMLLCIRQEKISLAADKSSELKQKWMEAISSLQEGIPEQILWKVYDRMVYEDMELRAVSQWPLVTSEERSVVQKEFFKIYPKQRAKDPMDLFGTLQKKIVFHRAFLTLQQKGVHVPKDLLPDLEQTFISRQGYKLEKTPESVILELWFDHLYRKYVIEMGQDSYFSPEEQQKLFIGTKDTMALKKIKDMEVAFLFVVARQILLKETPRMGPKLSRRLTEEEKQKLAMDFFATWKQSPWSITLEEVAAKMNLL